jgi:hypothetical protein
VKELLELEKKDGGKLSVDWLLTEAAIEVREGRIDGALPLISLARDGGNPALFNSCITDAFFVEAAQKHPRLAVACRVPPL